MSNELAKKRLAEEAARLSKKYGDKTGALGSTRFQLDVVPTGSLALDFALGTGGWPKGHPIHIYGQPDIGKSSTLGLAAFRNAQACGLTTGLIAVEPGFDGRWAEKNGVDTDMLVVARPNDGEEAFNILYEWMHGDLVDFVIFDSIGGVLPTSEDKEEAKARQGGASGLITSGVRRILQPCWKKNKGLIFLNQIRDNMNSRIPGQVKPPGGHALEHACDIWIHLRGTSGSDSIKKIKVDGDEVTVGKTLTAQITRNKMSEGTGVKAQFTFYSKGTEEYGPVGIDVTSDIIATGMRTGVIKRAGAYYRHPSFPGEKQQIQSAASVGEFFAENPKALAQVREDVLAVMFEKSGPIKNSAPDIEAYDEATAA